MLNPIASLGVYLAEMVICYFFFSDIFERRTTSLKCLVIGSVIFSAGSALNLLFNNNSMINSLTTFEGADIFLDYLSDQSKSMSVLYRTQIS